MRRHLLLSAAVMLAACSDASGPDKVTPIPGNYTLQTVNGRSLPFPLVNLFNAYRLELLSGLLTLNTNHTFREEDRLRESYPGENGQLVTADTTVVLTGTWEAEDSMVTLVTKEGGSILFGTAKNGRLTLHFEASNDSLYTFVYLRN